MFDYIICKENLPLEGCNTHRFQTKDLACNMYCYRISDGQLYLLQDFDCERSNDEDMWRAIKDSPGLQIFTTGVVRFYYYYDPPMPLGSHVMFLARFDRGRLTGPIELVANCL